MARTRPVLFSSTTAAPCTDGRTRNSTFAVAALLLPWFFLTPVIYPLGGVPGLAERHHTVVELLHWANFLTPGVEAIRDPLFWGRLPDWGDALYLVVAAVLSLALGAFVFSRVDDQIAIEV